MHIAHNPNVKTSGLANTVGKFIANSPGAITAAGAGLGAAAGMGAEALRGSPDKNYLQAGIRGAAVGGLAGGGTAVIGRVARDAMLMNPALSGAGNIAKATASRMGNSIENFGRRQLHGLTGHGAGDSAYLDRIGVMGNAPAHEKAKLMLRRGMDTGRPLDQVMAHHQALKEEGAIGQRFRDLGMTSVPGALKGAVTNPREAAGAIWNQVRGGGALGVAGAALPVVGAGADLARGDESAVGGRTMGQKALSAGGNIGSGLLFSGLPMLSQTVAGGVTDAVTGRLGRRFLAPQQGMVPA